MDNPFLPDFYKKKKGAAFQTQLFFLLSRYQQQREIAQIDLFTTLVVADYHFPKDKIFACLNLDDSELLIYDRLYTLLSETVRKPDLVIYLQGSLETCMKRIKKTSRAVEKGITPEYLAQLIEAYNYYFYHYEETPLLVVDTNEIDFVNRPAGLRRPGRPDPEGQEGRSVLRARAGKTGAERRSETRRMSPV